MRKPDMTNLGWDRLDALVDVDPLELRDIAFQLAGEHAKLAELRRWLATYPPIPDDVTGDPELMVVRTVRRILDGGAQQ